MNYQSIGSGGGIKQIQAKTVTFGATDAPLPGAELDKDGLVQFPMVMGGIVPVVNLDGHHAGLAHHRRRRRLRRCSSARSSPGTTRRSRSSTRASKLPNAGDCRGPSFGRIGHHVQLHRLSVEGQRRLEIQGRQQHRGRVAGRHRRQGQRRRRQQRRPDQGLDRLCRIRLRQAEQAELHQDAQQGRQDRRPDDRSVPGRGRQCRLEFGRPATA